MPDLLENAVGKPTLDYLAGKLAQAANVIEAEVRRIEHLREGHAVVETVRNLFQQMKELDAAVTKRRAELAALGEKLEQDARATAAAFRQKLIQEARDEAAQIVAEANSKAQEVETAAAEKRDELAGLEKRLAELKNHARTLAD